MKHYTYYLLFVFFFLSIGTARPQAAPATQATKNEVQTAVLEEKLHSLEKQIQQQNTFDKERYAELEKRLELRKEDLDEKHKSVNFIVNMLMV